MRQSVSFFCYIKERDWIILIDSTCFERLTSIIGVYAILLRYFYQSQLFVLLL